MSPLSEAQRKLVEDHVKLAFKVARDWRGLRHLDAEDRNSVALEALCEFAPKYDPGCGWSFRARATPYIGDRLKEESRKAGLVRVPRRKWRKGGGTHAEAAKGPVKVIFDVHPGRDGSPADEMVKEELSEALRDAIQALPDRERWAMSDYLEGLSYEQSGEKRGVSPNTINMWRTSALSLLRTALSREEMCL